MTQNNRKELKEIGNNQDRAKVLAAAYAAAENPACDTGRLPDGVEFIRGVKSNGQYLIVLTRDEALRVTGEYHFPGIRTGAHLARHVRRILG